MESESRMDLVIGAIITAIVGVALLTTALIPISVDMITSNLNTTALQKWNTLLYAVITMTVVGVMVGVIKWFTNSNLVTR